MNSGKPDRSVRREVIARYQPWRAVLLSLISVAVMMPLALMFVLGLRQPMSTSKMEAFAFAVPVVVIGYRYACAGLWIVFNTIFRSRAALWIEDEAIVVISPCFCSVSLSEFRALRRIPWPGGAPGENLQIETADGRKKTIVTSMLEEPTALIETRLAERLGGRLDRQNLGGRHGDDTPRALLRCQVSPSKAK